MDIFRLSEGIPKEGEKKKGRESPECVSFELDREI
jgi:hypothetical protein